MPFFKRTPHTLKSHIVDTVVNIIQVSLVYLQCNENMNKSNISQRQGKITIFTNIAWMRIL